MRALQCSATRNSAVLAGFKLRRRCKRNRGCLFDFACAVVHSSGSSGSEAQCGSGLAGGRTGGQGSAAARQGVVVGKGRESKSAGTRKSIP